MYGTLEPNAPAFTEETAYAPNSPYSASKAASDHLVRAYHHTYGLEVTTSNCSNNYGPYHFPEKLIPLIITNILQNKPLPIYGDGQQVRDWLYVEDHSRGIELVLEQGRIGENYNIGGHNEWTNIDIVTVVCKLMNQYFTGTEGRALEEKFPQAKQALEGKCEALITYVADRVGHDRRYAIDATKTNNELGYRPAESFESGIKKTVEWYLNNEKWWGHYLMISIEAVAESLSKFTRAKNSNVPTFRGNVDYWDGNSLFGWYVFPENAQGPKITIEGKELKSLNHNAFRRDLVSNGVCETGLSGFEESLDVNQLRAQSVTSFTVGTEDIELVGSPIVVKEPKLKGYVDSVEQSLLSGWVYDESYPW